MRAVVPVRDADGDEVIALVSVGITVSDIDKQLRRDVVVILLCAAAVLALGLLGAAVVEPPAPADDARDGRAGDRADV